MEKINKVFLGGTCCHSTWRDKLIPMIEGKVDYFNPVVKDWTPECQKIEYEQKEICHYQVYAITPLMKGVFSIAEIIESVHTPNTKTFIYIQEEDEDKNSKKIKFDYGQMKSLAAVCDLAEKHGGVICDSLEDLAQKLIEDSDAYFCENKADENEQDSMAPDENFMVWRMYAEYEDEWEDFCDEDGYINLLVNISSGLTRLLKPTKKGGLSNSSFNNKSIFFKLTDGFICQWKGKVYEGYVPEFAPIGDGGFGDYIEFDTDKKGYIKGWSEDNCLSWLNENWDDFEDAIE